MRSETTNKIGFQLVNRKDNNRLPQLVLLYQPYGRKVCRSDQEEDGVNRTHRSKRTAVMTMTIGLLLFGLGETIVTFLI
jgi:hypothetical protein